MAFFNDPIYFIDNEVQKIYNIRCHVYDVVNKDILYEFLCILILLRPIFFIDPVIEKVVHTTYYINFSYTIHLYTNMTIPRIMTGIISRESFYVLSNT